MVPTLRHRSAAGGISLLSGLYFKSGSKTVWSGYQTFETSQGIIYSYNEYGLGGDSQQEAIAGLELGWQALTLELRAGLRHKEFEEYLGRSSESQDAPKLGGRLTLHDVLGCEFSGFYTWDPDLKVFGGEARRQLWGPIGLVARAEQVSGADRPDNICYFLGFGLWLGSQPMPRGASALPGALAKAQEERQAVQMRQVQRQTRLTEVAKGDLGTKAEIIVQAQQYDGQFSVVRLRTSKNNKSVRVDSVQFASNLGQCSANAILHDPGLTSNPPTPLTIGQVPDQVANLSKDI